MLGKKKYKQIFSSILTLVMLLTFNSTMAFADTKLPVSNENSGVSAINVENNLAQYNINVKFNEPNKTFTATESVKFTNTYGKDLKSLVFHLYADSYGSIETMPTMGIQKEKLSKEEIGDINITKVTIGNSEMKFTQDNQILKIIPTAAIKPNEVVDIKINFTLKLPMSQNRLGYYNNVYSVTNWYPIISMYDVETDTWDENPFHPVGESNYSDIANYKVSINVPDNMELASTGITNSSRKEKDGTKTYDIMAEKVRDFVFIMSPEFKVITKEVDGITVNSFYIYDGNENTTETAEALLGLTLDALSFFGENFGKYPYKEFDTVETYVQGFAMEYPQLIQMGKYNINPEFTEESMVHEVAHQWWYVTVGNNEFENPFLDESLTAFSTAYYFEKTQGKYSKRGVTLGLRNLMDFARDISSPINSSVDEISSKEWGKTVYIMGALVIEDIRQALGEEKLLEIMRTYYAENSLKNANLDSLLDVIERVGGKEYKELVLSNINSKDFYPENLRLNESELTEIREIRKEERKETRENSKQWLEQLRNEGKDNFGAFFVQALDNYDVYLVMPSKVNIAKENMNKFDLMINTLKMTLEEGLGLNIIIKEDKDITENELKEKSLIFIGDNNENTALNSIMDKFPIDLSKEEIKFNGITIENKNITGMLVGNTSKNKNNNVLIFLGMDKLESFNLLNSFDFYDKQFVLNFNDKTLKGNYDK
ncbi:M1 family metallopeptidase [Clostridium butanoliproducens]|uniref:M1 family metallopeptidase n=1 Tax=Clostridium butanoliproducens TaxID=2991837 RepID=UPI0024BBD637|nr:M1 family metallopeptidase [Clostridium butanoliproducens]